MNTGHQQIKLDVYLLNYAVSRTTMLYNNLTVRLFDVRFGNQNSDILADKRSLATVGDPKIVFVLK